MRNKFLIFLKLITICLIVISFFSFIKDEPLYPYRKKNKWGYCNKEKKIIIPCKYQKTYPFIAGVAKIEKKKKFGFINVNNKIIIPAEYDEAKDFDGRCIKVTKNKQVYWLDSTGKINVNCSIPGGNDFSGITVDGREIFKGKNGKFGLIENKDAGSTLKYDTILSAVYDKMERIGYTAYFVVALNGKCGVINYHNKELIAIDNDVIRPIVYNDDDLWGFVLGKNNLVGFANAKGKITVEPKYVEINRYPNTNLLFVKTIKNKIGYVLSLDGTEFF